MSATPSKATLSIHVENAVIERIDLVAAAEDRSRSYVAARILRNAVLSQIAAEQEAMPTAVNFATSQPKETQ